MPTTPAAPGTSGNAASVGTAMKWRNIERMESRGFRLRVAGAQEHVLVFDVVFWEGTVLGYSSNAEAPAFVVQFSN